MWIPRRTAGPIAVLDHDVTFGSTEFSPSMEYASGDRVALCWRGPCRQLVDARVVELQGHSLTVELIEDLQLERDEGHPSRAGERTQVAESDVWFVELAR